MKAFSRTCSLCGEFITGQKKDFLLHGEKFHPEYETKLVGDKSIKLVYTIKKYFCPLDNTWYSCLKWLSRAITKCGYTNEQYYLEYGLKYLPDKWKENSSKKHFGYRHLCNTCLQCEKSVKFQERKWQYPVFCGSNCSTQCD